MTFSVGLVAYCREPFYLACGNSVMELTITPFGDNRRDAYIVRVEDRLVGMIDEAEALAELFGVERSRLMYISVGAVWASGATARATRGFLGGIGEEGAANKCGGAQATL